MNAGGVIMSLVFAAIGSGLLLFCAEDIAKSRKVSYGLLSMAHSEFAEMILAGG